MSLCLIPFKRGNGIGIGSEVRFGKAPAEGNHGVAVGGEPARPSYDDSVARCRCIRERHVRKSSTSFGHGGAFKDGVLSVLAFERSRPVDILDGGTEEVALTGESDAAALVHPCRARSGRRRAQPQGAATATRNGKTTCRCAFGAGGRVAGQGVTGGVHQLQQCRRSSSSTSASPSSSIASRSASIAPASVSSHSALTAASSRGRPGRGAPMTAAR